MTKLNYFRPWVAVTPSLVALLVLFLPVRFAAAEPPARLAGLTRAWKDPNAVRSVFFIHGMSCRACTMLLDRRLSTTAGLFWARFNFPLRTLTVYHDPRALPTRTIVQFVAEARQPTPAEAGVARFLLEKIMFGDEGSEGRARFDDWLLALWREASLDYRGEYLEAGI